MNAAQWSEPGDTAAAPDRVALVVGLRRLHRAAKPRAVATREVVVRSSAQAQPRRVYQARTGRE